MPGIPQYFATQQTELSRMPRASQQLADTGQGLEAEALGQFGKAFVGISMESLNGLVQRRTDTELAEAGALWDREHMKFFTNLAKDPDLDNYEKKYKAFAKSLRRQMLKKGLTQRSKHALTKWITTQQPAMEKDAARILMRKQSSHGRATMLRAINDYEISGNEDAAHKIIDKAYKNNFITAEEAERERQAVSEKVDWYEGLQLIDSRPEDFLEYLEGDAAFLPNLNPEQKLQLKARAIRQLGAKLAQQRGIREQQINVEQGRLMNLARSSRLTDDIIRTSKLEEFGTGSKDTFYKMLDAQAEAEIEKKENPYLKSDPTVKASILQMIRDPKVDVTANDISGLMGKGLSINDAQSMISNIDFFKDPFFRRADSYLKSQLGWSDSLTRFAHPEGGLSYSLAMNEMFDAIETEKLKGRDVLDRATQISIPYLMDYYENVLMYKGEQLEKLKKMLGAKTKPGRPTKTETPKSRTDPQGIFE